MCVCGSVRGEGCGGGVIPCILKTVCTRELVAFIGLDDRAPVFEAIEYAPLQCEEVGAGCEISSPGQRVFSILLALYASVPGTPQAVAYFWLLQN